MDLAGRRLVAINALLVAVVITGCLYPYTATNGMMVSKANSAINVAIRLLLFGVYVEVAILAYEDASRTRFAVILLLSVVLAGIALYSFRGQPSKGMREGMVAATVLCGLLYL